MSGRTREQLQRSNQMQHRDNHRLAVEIRRLREALQVIADCPPEAVHLMPLAAQAALAGNEPRTTSPRPREDGHG